MSDGLRGRLAIGGAHNTPLALPADFPLPHPLDFDWRFHDVITVLPDLADLRVSSDHGSEAELVQYIENQLQMRP